MEDRIDEVLAIVEKTKQIIVDARREKSKRVFGHVIQAMKDNQFQIQGDAIAIRTNGVIYRDVDQKFLSDMLDQHGMILIDMNTALAQITIRFK